MSDTQIKQIMTTLAEQNKVLQSIREEQGKAKEEIQILKAKLEPVHKIFSSVTGFNAIAVWILKALIMFGAGVGVVYGFIVWLRSNH